MDKELIEKISEDIENDSNEAETTKRLCVHDLTRKLKEKQKKENVSKVVILFILILFIGFLILFIY
ncbi:hypothetical protein OAL31_00070 [Candidatus Pelagibacter sp.]|nr:hypothetical protein [Candidatus Pelagibacter sp.]